MSEPINPDNLSHNQPLEKGGNQTRERMPLDNEQAMNELAGEMIKKYKAATENRTGQLFPAEKTREQLEIDRWLKPAAELMDRKATTYEWKTRLIDHLRKDADPDLAEFYETTILEPIKTEREANNEKAREWLKKAIAERGITVHGKTASSSDLDGNMAIALLREAGLVEPGVTKIRYVTHPEFAEGKGNDAALIVDIGKGDFSVGSSVKTDVARELFLRTGSEQFRESREPQIPVDPDNTSVVLDHHGPESHPGSGSASRKTYEMLVALGLLEPTAEREAIIQAVDAMDDKTYLAAGFRVSPYSLAGLSRHKVRQPQGGERVLQFIDTKKGSASHLQFDQRFIDLMIASGGDPAKALTEEELREVGLWKEAQAVQKKLWNAREFLERLKDTQSEHGNIRPLEPGRWLLVEEDRKITGDDQLLGLETVDILYEQGISDYISYKTTPKEKRGVFVNSQTNPEALIALQKKYKGGELVRGKMWVLNSPDAPLPTPEEIIELLNTKPENLEVTRLRAELTKTKEEARKEKEVREKLERDVLASFKELLKQNEGSFDEQFTDNPALLAMAERLGGFDTSIILAKKRLAGRADRRANDNGIMAEIPRVESAPNPPLSENLLVRAQELIGETLTKIRPFIAAAAISAIGLGIGGVTYGANRDTLHYPVIQQGMEVAERYAQSAKESFSDMVTGVKEILWPQQETGPRTGPTRIDNPLDREINTERHRQQFVKMEKSLSILSNINPNVSPENLNQSVREFTDLYNGLSSGQQQFFDQYLKTDKTGKWGALSEAWTKSGMGLVEFVQYRLLNPEARSRYVKKIQVLSPEQQKLANYQKELFRERTAQNAADLKRLRNEARAPIKIGDDAPQTPLRDYRLGRKTNSGPWYEIDEDKMAAAEAAQKAERERLSGPWYEIDSQKIRENEKRRKAGIESARNERAAAIKEVFNRTPEERVAINLLRLVLQEDTATDGLKAMVLERYNNLSETDKASLAVKITSEDAYQLVRDAIESAGFLTEGGTPDIARYLQMLINKEK